MPEEIAKWYGDIFRWCYELSVKSKICTEGDKEMGRYTAIMEHSIPLNSSKSKKIVMGLDFQRGLMPFVSIENSKSRGVVLTLDEYSTLYDPEWSSIVNSHMAKPSYQVNTKYTKNHEFRCGMVEGKPVLQISPLNGRGGYVYIGEATWRNLRVMCRLIEAYLQELRVRVRKLPLELSVLCTHFLEKCQKLNLTKSLEITRNIDMIFSSWVLSDDTAYNYITNNACKQDEYPYYHDLRVCWEIVYLYPERLAQMICHLLIDADMVKKMTNAYPDLAVNDHSDSDDDDDQSENDFSV